MYPQQKVELTLEYPVTHGGKEITTLSIRRPKVRDNLIAAKKKAGEEQEVCMMALLAEVDEAVIHEMDMEDMEALQKKIMGFRKKAAKSETTSAE